MAIETYKSISCDVCGNDLPSSYSITAAEARREAKNEGWRRKYGFDLCPNCECPTVFKRKHKARRKKV